MNVRRRMISATCAALAACLATAASAGAASVSIQVPATAEVGKVATLTYSGFADSDGTAVVTGSGQNMQLRTFLQKDSSGCQPTSAAQRSAPGSKFDGDMFVESPAPFTLTSDIRFETAGTFTICAYLEVGLTNDTVPPSAFASAVLRVGAEPIPCTVPKLSGLTLTSATTKLRAAGCALGKVSKPRKVSRRAKLVVRSQSVEPQVRLASGFKVNVVLKAKTAKKR